MKNEIITITSKYQDDRHRLMDILIDIHDLYGYVSEADIELLSERLGMSEVEINETITFYHFFSRTPRGQFNIFLNNSITACMRGHDLVKKALEEACGTTFGSVSQDGMFGLYSTSCIGMNDQGPSAIINDKVFTNLTTYRVMKLVADLKSGKSPDEAIYESTGDGNNSDPYVRAMVLDRKSVV